VLRLRTTWRAGGVVAMIYFSVWTKEILADVREERERQNAKFGDQSHLPFDRWLVILTEELGEAAKDHLEGRNPELEMIQVAAVAVACIESLRRKKDRG